MLWMAKCITIKKKNFSFKEDKMSKWKMFSLDFRISILFCVNREH